MPRWLSWVRVPSPALPILSLLPIGNWHGSQQTRRTGRYARPTAEERRRVDAPGRRARGRRGRWRGRGRRGRKPLKLEVDIQPRSACERHVTVKVSREDIDRYFDKEFSELVTSAPGAGLPARARAAQADRAAVSARKCRSGSSASLLTDSIAQISDEQELSAISEPNFDLEAVEVPDEGPMTYEFDLEVRPEFDAAAVEGPVDRAAGPRVHRPGRGRGAAEPACRATASWCRYDGPAESGDYISTNLAFTYEGQALSSAAEELIRIRPVLSFRDGKIEKFDELMAGVRGGRDPRRPRPC